MSNPLIPSDSEQYLTGVAECARLAVIIDQLRLLNGQLPVGFIPVDIGGANAANAAATATMPAVADKTNYITGFDVTGLGATTAAGVDVVVSGLLDGDLTYSYGFVAGATLANPVLSIKFPRPIPALDVNTAIVVTCPAGGAGALKNRCVVHGFVR